MSVTTSMHETTLADKERIVLRCHDLSKYYRQGSDRIKVLNHLNFELKRGERTAIVGASGSGKSTLLALLGGLDQPSEGRVELLNQELAALGDEALSGLRNREMGFVYQFHHLLPEFTALENVALPAVLASCSRRDADQMAMGWLQSIGLDHRANHLPSELSGGERQRTAIARALINRPGIVLMDEPTGNLDTASSANVLETIDQLSRESDTAFVIVTHDETVASVMDRVYQLEDGQLERR